MLLTPAITRNQTSERTEQWTRLWQQAMRQEIPPYLGFVVAGRIGDGSWVLLRKHPQANPTTSGTSKLPSAPTLPPTE